MKLSIILPSFRRADLLGWGLESIRRQKVTFDYEILVLNDGIPDETESICKRFGADYYFTGQRNINGLIWRCPGTVINFGVSIAKAENILIACPEIYLIQDTILQRLTEEVIIGRNTISITKGYDDTAGRFLEHLKQGGNWSTFSPEGLVGYLHTRYPFCLCMTKSRFNSIGGYDEEFTGGVGFDDTDFYFRAVKAGIVYSEQLDLEIIHLYHDRCTRAGIDHITYNKLLERNKQLYMTKNNTIKYL